MKTIQILKHIIITGVESWYFCNIIFLKNHNPLNIPTPTPAPDHLLGGHKKLHETSIENQQTKTPMGIGWMPSSLDLRSTELIVSPKKVVGCRGGNQNREGCWWFPYLTIKSHQISISCFSIDMKFISKIL